MKTLLRVASLVVVAAGIGVATPAFAAGTTATALSITATRPAVFTGQPNVFKAAVSPAKVGKTKITGAVTWTITGRDGSTVSCASTSPINGGGYSECKVGKAVLMASASPYTVVASYSGDANFAPATNLIQYAVTSAVTRVKIVIADKPTSGASTTVEAVVVGGPGTSTLTGQVTFAAASGLGTRGVKPYCAGSNPVATANNAQPLVDGTATCVLPAGWFVVPVASTANKHPKTSWSISVTYDGNASFYPITSNKMGTSNH